ncbi:hypothetical protein pipiens_012649 [Culex pipiens pipiens]|uniref:Uncharacterized protein n=1 Tax=Culex pipiens pipiens TaxID=38569 RepID=A0ABD1D1M7_CULPP
MGPGSSTTSVYWRRGVTENLLVFDTVPLAVYDHLKTPKSVNDFEELSLKLKTDIDGRRPTVLYEQTLRGIARLAIDQNHVREDPPGAHDPDSPQQPRDCPQKSKCVIRKSQTALAMSVSWMP